jgi:CheY-like chemotaxis protein
MAEDDEEDQMLVEEAFSAASMDRPLVTVHDGVELMAYLRGEPPFVGARLPALILMDLNMPRKDGREALKEIKQDPNLRRIPIIVLTTSSADTDIVYTYELGVSTYIRKPSTFDALVNVVRTMDRYWFEIAELPEGQSRSAC